MKKNRSPEMRKIALLIAEKQPDGEGLAAVNFVASKIGEPLYPESTWGSLVKNEVPRVQKYGDQFFNSHTTAPCTFSQLKDKWPI